MTPALPPYVARSTVQERLFQIFPEGAPRRDYCTRDTASAVVFTMLYVGAVEGSSRWAAPKHIYRMSDVQAEQTSDSARLDYTKQAMVPGYKPSTQSWYADTSREPVRDETIRKGLIELGAAAENQTLPKTSPKGRYALKPGFAKLFDPKLQGEHLEAAITEWRELHLSRNQLARLRLVHAGATAAKDEVNVLFPNGRTRALSAGTSSIISRAVIEEFAPRFLEQAAVVWLADTKAKSHEVDEKLAAAVGLEIDTAKTLPDIILADLRSDQGKPTLLVFVEVVATDGPVDDHRRAALMELARGFDPEHVAFVTAFEDRDAAPAKRLLSSIAWNSFVWYAADPDAIMALNRPRDGAKLHDMMACNGR